jgi:hypothetical protein
MNRLYSEGVVKSSSRFVQTTSVVNTFFNCKLTTSVVEAKLQRST